MGCRVLVHIFFRYDINLSLVEAIVISISNIGQDPFISSHGIDQVDEGRVLILDRDEISLFLNGGLLISMRFELIKYASIEGSNDCVHCIFKQYVRHISILKDIDRLINV
jgi:hypothetical protein